MASVRTVAVCLPQVPLLDGGAELLARSLVRELEARGLEACLVTVPYRWNPREHVLRSCLAWRLLDLHESAGRRIDLLIATKFPSYAARHERKVTWLFHQFRQVYDLWGTPYSEYGHGEPPAAADLALREQVERVDARTLGESRALFSISRRVSGRLRRYNGLEAEVLHPPPFGSERFQAGEQGDYVLSVGRLESTKRTAPLIEALVHTDRELRAVVVGEGPEAPALRARAAELGLEERVAFRPRVSFDELVKLYSGALAVYFAPWDEDYGFVTLEAFLSHKPVVTAPDAGGPLEFVEDGVNGVVVALEPRALGERLQALHTGRARASELGGAGYERVRHLRWDPIVERLLAA